MGKFAAISSSIWLTQPKKSLQFCSILEIIVTANEFQELINDYFTEPADGFDSDSDWEEEEEEDLVSLQNANNNNVIANGDGIPENGEVMV